MNILSNKVALVTSACSELGKAITEELISKGLKVIGLSSDMNKLKVLRLMLFNSIKRIIESRNYNRLFNKSNINKLLFINLSVLS